MTFRFVRYPWLDLLMLLPLAGVADTRPNPQPLAKIGPCASGYTTSGAFCLRIRP